MGALGKFLLAGALVGVVGATSGCAKLLKKKKKPDTGVTDDPTAQAKPPEGADDPDDVLQDKVNEYIRCQNATSSGAWAAYRRYRTSIPKTGPTGRETFAYTGTLPKGSAAVCTTNIAKGKTMPPSDPKLEAAGEVYTKAIVEFDGLMNELYPYFENKDFRDDKWAKGKSLHPKVLAAFGEFSKADTALHETLAGITKPLSQRTLARIEKEDGKRFYWHRLNTLNNAREVLEATNPPQEDDDIDVTLYTSALTDFEAALDGLTGYGDGHKAELNDQKKAKNWPLASSNYDRFVKEAAEFRKASKNFFRCVRDAPANTKRPNGKVDVEKIRSCPEGKPTAVQDNVFKEYNEFIRVSNANRFP